MSKRAIVPGDFAISFTTFLIAALLFVAAFVVVGSIEEGIFSVELRMVPYPRLSITGVFAAGMALLLAVHAPFARWHAGRAPLVIAMAMLGWFPLLFAIGDYEMGEALVPGPTYDNHGSIDPNPSDSLLPTAVLVILVLSPIAFAGVAPLLLRTVRARPVAAITAWIVGALLVASGLWHARKLPDTDMYIYRLPIVATVKEDDRTSLDGTEVLYTEKGITAHDYYGCHLETQQPYPNHVIVGPQLPCHEIQILRDDRYRLWIVPGDHGAALRMGTLEQIVVHPRTISASLAPPIGWLLGGSAGLLLALVPLAAAFVFRRRALHIDGRDAVHRGGGRIEVEDGRTVELSAAASLPIGPVRVDTAHDRSSDYRTSPPLPSRVLAVGSIADARAELDSRAAGASLTALVIVLLASATLFAAAAHGI